MENDVLKNKIAPWQEKGRWYHCEVASDGNAWTLNKDQSDPLFSTSLIVGNYLRVLTPDLNTYKKCIMDLKYKFNSPMVSGQDITTTSSMARLYASSVQGILFFGPAKYVGKIDIYIFID